MAENTLYYGDNLDILRRYIKDETIDFAFRPCPFAFLLDIFPALLHNTVVMAEDPEEGIRDESRSATFVRAVDAEGVDE
jgi:hypothetical protein